jgi:uncharacterized protein YfaQ (DUF2300 family)
MDNKITAAAREAGWSEMQIKMAWPADHERLTKFYAIAYHQGLEDAAKAIGSMEHGNVRVCAEAIRALKEKDHG